ncbi:hypothetical protein Hypma_013066 [Hypsizygus marmoreus]|uniref:Uncharacterized protein n=1 Tax=Hypsizygus marmoreus TaxID=39966 RepID=A0A369JDZ0_HYPMA|nr:hypothetical protein Hypma_013066 [Hypsizygus marmoreus]
MLAIPFIFTGVLALSSSSFAHPIDHAAGAGNVPFQKSESTSRLVMKRAAVYDADNGYQYYDGNVLSHSGGRYTQPTHRAPLPGQIYEARPPSPPNGRVYEPHPPSWVTSESSWRSTSGGRTHTPNVNGQNIRTATPSPPPPSNAQDGHRPPTYPNANHPPLPVDQKAPSGHLPKPPPSHPPPSSNVNNANSNHSHSHYNQYGPGHLASNTYSQHIPRPDSRHNGHSGQSPPSPPSPPSPARQASPNGPGIRTYGARPQTAGSNQPSSSNDNVVIPRLPDTRGQKRLYEQITGSQPAVGNIAYKQRKTTHDSGVVDGASRASKRREISGSQRPVGNIQYKRKKTDPKP